MEIDAEALAKMLHKTAEELQEAEERREEEPKMEERYNRARGGATLLKQSSEDAMAILEALKAQKKKREDAATAVADEASAEEKDLADAGDVDAVTLCIEFLELHTETIAPTALADLAAAQEKAASYHAFAEKQTVKLEERRAKVTEQEASLDLAQAESAGKIERLQAELERERAKPKEGPRELELLLTPNGKRQEDEGRLSKRYAVSASSPFALTISRRTADCLYKRKR